MLQASLRFLSVALIGLFAIACGNSTTDATGATNATAAGDSVATQEAAPGATALDTSFESALNRSGDVGAFRTLTYQGQTLQIEPLGVESIIDLDLNRPNVLAETDVTGSQYLRMDVGATAAAANPALGPVFFDTWSTADRLVFDTTGYEALEQMNPGQLGVFSPGVFEVKLDSVGDIEGGDLSKLLVGSTVPGIDTMAAGLLDKLESPTSESDDSTFIGTMTLGEMLEIQGSSSAEAAASLAAGMAPGLGLDGQVLADHYATTYDAAELDVTVTIGANNLLESVAYQADMSSVYDGMADLIATSSAMDDATESDIDELRQVFTGAVFTIDMVTVFEPDDSIVVEPPAGDLEDRTEAMVAFFVQSGIDFSN